MAARPEIPELVGTTEVRWRGRRLAFFAGCDYLRLARHPAVIRSARATLKSEGLGVSASRLTTGDHPLYRELEAALARFLGARRALLVGAGYLANLVTAQALAGDFSHVLLDERSHPALLDAALLLGGRRVPFAHRDVAAVDRIVRRLPAGARVVLLTDGLFALDGSVAPLAEYRRVLPATAWLWVDDAHGAGVLGDRGQGTREYEGIGRRRLIQTLSLAKAFGSHGGAVAVDDPGVMERIVSGSRAYLGHTPPALPVAAAALAALRLLERDPARWRRLRANALWVKTELLSAGVLTEATPGPVVCLAPPAEDSVRRRLDRRLMAAGVYPSFLRYHAGPGRHRFVISSEHTTAQLRALVTALRG